MPRRTRDVVLVLIAIVFSAACISLGFWQLRRLAARRALNARIVHRLDETPVSVDSLPRDTATLHYRAVTVRGTYDYAHELVIADRTRNGAPGVDIVTPVRTPASDTALLLVRGWVYAPDGLTVDLSTWREGDTVSSTGYARPLDVPYPGRPTLAGHPNAYRWIDLRAIRASVPYPVYPFLVVLGGDTSSASARRAHSPPRVPPPPLDEGPHMSYAIQWFSFAAIAIVGTIFFLRAGGAGDRRRDEPALALEGEPLEERSPQDD